MELKFEKRGIPYLKPLLQEVQAQEQTIRIQSPEDLIRLAEDCRLDSYSLGLTVKLTRDLDMTGYDFEGIPVFSGTFEGGGYRITGWQIRDYAENRCTLNDCSAALVK